MVEGSIPIKGVLLEINGLKIAIFLMATFCAIGNKRLDNATARTAYRI